MHSRFRRIAVALVLTIAATGVGTAEESEHFVKSRDIPSEYKSVAEFLDYLKPAKQPRSGFDISIAPQWDLDRLMSFISDKGLTMSDVNQAAAKVQQLSPKQIRSAVAARKGQPFQMLVHLGYIYAQPYKQYSELRFEPRLTGVVVHMASWYRMTFDLPDGQPKLARLDYLMREGH